METYIELKQRQAKELNDFKGLFFAFSNEQFKEGMQQIGLTEDDKKLIISIGAGGYILKTKNDEFKNMFKRHAKEKRDRAKEEKFLIESIAYELNNHEYCITGDTEDALLALGLEENDVNPDVLKKAIKLSESNCNECKEAA